MVGVHPVLLLFLVFLLHRSPPSPAHSIIISAKIIEPRLARVALRCLDEQDKYMIYAMYKHVENMDALICYLTYKLDSSAARRRSHYRMQRIEQVSGRGKRRYHTFGEFAPLHDAYDGTRAVPFQDTELQLN